MSAAASRLMPVTRVGNCYMSAVNGPQSSPRAAAGGGGSPRFSEDSKFRKHVLVFLVLVVSGFMGMALFFRAAPSIDGYVRRAAVITAAVRVAAGCRAVQPVVVPGPTLRVLVRCIATDRSVTVCPCCPSSSSRCRRPSVAVGTSSARRGTCGSAPRRTGLTTRRSSSRRLPWCT